VEFCIANSGEDPRPLRRIASGGELSRLMLALRKILGRHDPICTSIYDEVDAGISGAVADLVGRSLAQVAQHRQVICVTHLPQVAAHADFHFHVEKKSDGERTATWLRQLDKKNKIEALARMLGGEKISHQARANARQLLKAATGGGNEIFI
jgi:DNA repair protein RecN (Recombination protein N)